jgi:hypothetical protein
MLRVALISYDQEEEMTFTLILVLLSGQNRESIVQPPLVIGQFSLMADCQKAGQAATFVTAGNLGPVDFQASQFLCVQSK